MLHPGTHIPEQRPGIRTMGLPCAVCGVKFGWFLDLRFCTKWTVVVV